MEYKVINLLQTRELKAKFTKSEESILDFIEKNFDKIPKYSVVKLCEEAYASQASVNRVCKKLGFKGFSELKYSIEQDLEKMENSKNLSINNTFFYIENINFQDVQGIAEVIKENRKILIYGLGASQITASYLQRQLLYLGFQAIVV
ncbi:MAG: MurR/RpiR family transcriptional regulator, partial [Cetobacterium sp.]